MVNLTRIYTRTGDGGETRLGDMSVTTKNDTRLHAYADVDEANAQLGVVMTRRPRGGRPRRPDTRAERPLRRRRRPLHARSCPIPSTRRCGSSRSTSTASRAGATTTTRSCRALRSFILNGGTPGAAQLHVARTVVRRAERAAWAAYDEHGEAMNKLAITYLNRLSDLLFILARYANREQGDVLWVPGGERGDQRQKGDA